MMAFPVAAVERVVSISRLLGEPECNRVATLWADDVDAGEGQIVFGFGEIMIPSPRDPSPLSGDDGQHVCHGAPNPR